MRRESRSACVVVVESADSWERNNPSALDRFDVAAPRRSLLQCLVDSVLVIVIPVRAKEAPEMAFAKNDHVVEALAANGADDSLDVWILPRTSRRGDDFFDSHGADPSCELFAVDRIAIPQQVARSFVPRECLGDLSSSSCRTGMIRDAEVDDLPTLMSQHDEAVEQLKRDGRYDEKVDRCGLHHVILQEGLPGLRRRACAPSHVFSDGGLSDFVAE